VGRRRAVFFEPWGTLAPGFVDEARLLPLHGTGADLIWSPGSNSSTSVMSPSVLAPDGRRWR
jgi:hypothetical protein